MEVKIDLEKLREQGLFVGIPMYGGMCFGSTTKALMDLAILCKSRDINLQTHFLFNESLVQRARNYVADEFMRSKCEYMIFIDADIKFEAIDVLAMWQIMNDNPEMDVACAPYPKKTIAWEKIKSAVDKGFADEDANNLENFVGDYVFSAVGKSHIQISEPAEISEGGTGFMMIKRSTFEKFKETYPDLQYKPDHIRSANFDGSRTIGLFFHCEVDPETNRYLSEDYWFCKKIKEAGMKIWLLPWMRLEHTGTYNFKGSLAHIASVGESINADTKKIKKR
jgi:hypothetical protein